MNKAFISIVFAIISSNSFAHTFSIDNAHDKEVNCRTYADGIKLVVGVTKSTAKSYSQIADKNYKGAHARGLSAQELLPKASVLVGIETAISFQNRASSFVEVSPSMADAIYEKAYQMCVADDSLEETLNDFFPRYEPYW